MRILISLIILIHSLNNFILAQNKYGFSLTGGLNQYKPYLHNKTLVLSTYGDSGRPASQIGYDLSSTFLRYIKDDIRLEAGVSLHKYIFNTQSKDYTFGSYYSYNIKNTLLGIIVGGAKTFSVSNNGYLIACANFEISKVKKSLLTERLSDTNNPPHIILRESKSLYFTGSIYCGFGLKSTNNSVDIGPYFSYLPNGIIDDSYAWVLGLRLQLTRLLKG